MQFTVKDILNTEVAPALGCTEIAAIALGAAAASSLLPDKKVKSIEVWLDQNLYKNAFAAMIPGTDGLFGIEMALALGALGGDPMLKLEVLEVINNKVITEAQDFLRKGKIKVSLFPGKKGLYIKTIVQKDHDSLESIITDLHDNIVSLSINGNEVINSSLLLEKRGNARKIHWTELEKWLKSLSLESLFSLTNDLDLEDMEFIEQGMQYNMQLVNYGLKNGPGLSVGKTLAQLEKQQVIKRDMIFSARMMTAAAADARMAGVKLPAMSCAGSGNQGLTAVLPIWAVKDYIRHSRKSIFKAIALSYIITSYIRAHIGRLAALCGSSIAGGAGAAAGVAYLLGGNIKQIADAINNVIGDLGGVLCDGAKPSCALKLSTAAGTAVLAALFSIKGCIVKHRAGIIGASIEETVKNIGALSTQGMIDVDRIILKIILEKHFLDF